MNFREIDGNVIRAIVLDLHGKAHGEVLSNFFQRGENTTERKIHYETYFAGSGCLDVIESLIEDKLWEYEFRKI